MRGGNGAPGASMVHWNGEIMCAMDIETTGTDPYWNEITQLTVLPLDSNCVPRKDILPFNMYVRPQCPERIDEDAIKKQGRSLEDVLTKGREPDDVIELFGIWVDKLGLPYTPSGQRKRIIPLGHNYCFDYSFLVRFFGTDLYSEYFSGHYRDTMTAALYLNDRAGMHAEAVFVNKVKLTFIASMLKMDVSGAHNSLIDCQLCAAVYRKMLQMGLLG